MFERITKARAVGRIREAESWQIGRDHTVAVGQGRNEVAEHVRRRWEAVQQEKGWGSIRAGFTIKDPRAVDDGMLILDHSVSPQRIYSGSLMLVPLRQRFARSYDQMY